MAFSHEFDPAKGFVALPCDIMEFDMSPGAFRLLVELCRMANRSGECWPSLGQLSDRIGRSKAAISGYIAELRGLELVETLNQRMANGYNYRLKYCVTFWQSWRNGLSAQKTERSVQPVERRESSKNHIQEKQTLREASVSDSVRPKLVPVISKWSELAKNAPFPNFNAPVPEKLCAETCSLLQHHFAEPLSEKQVLTALKALWRKHGIAISNWDLTEQAKHLRQCKLTEKGLVAFCAEVDAIWEPHWKKPPNPHQLAVLQQAAQKRNKDEGMLRLLAQFLRRWEISQNKLHVDSASLSLTEKQAA